MHDIGMKLKGGRTNDNLLHGILNIISTSMFDKLCGGEEEAMANTNETDFFYPKFTEKPLDPLPLRAGTGSHHRWHFFNELKAGVAVASI